MWRGPRRLLLMLSTLSPVNGVLFNRRSQLRSFGLDHDGCSLETGCGCFYSNLARLFQSLHQCQAQTVEGTAPRLSWRTGFVWLVTTRVTVANANQPSRPNDLKAHFV